MGKDDSPVVLAGFPSKTCRELDRLAIDELGMASLILMEHASLGATRLALDMLAREGIKDPGAAHIRILCGPGNNGGDGYAMARHLHNAGAQVEVWDLMNPLHIQPRGDAGHNRSLLLRMGLETRAAFTALPDEEIPTDLWVDAIFGTGLSRPPEGVFADAIERLNRNPAPVLAVDIPSGLDADDGLPLGVAVQARCTATFGLVKQGFLRPGAARFTGELFCVPIGVPRQLLPPGTPAYPPEPIPVAGEAVSDS